MPTDYMAPFREALWEELGAAVPEALPTAGGGGIWRALRGRRTPVERIADSGLPYLVVGINPPAASPLEPADEDVYRHVVEVYVFARGGEDEEALWALLGAVRLRFEAEIGARNMAAGRCVKVLGVDSSWWLPPADRAISKQLDIISGCVRLLFDCSNFVE